MSPHIAILGGGPGGYVAASHAAARGARVTLVEAGTLGGTCLNRGCIPTKTLVESCSILEKARRANTYGLRLEGRVEADWPALRDKAGQVVNLLGRGLQALMADRRVVHLQGRGRLLGPRSLEVEGHGTVEADALLICTGSAPIRPSGFASDPGLVSTSDELLTWEALPESLLIVGEGVVACEFAFIMRALGVEVTMLGQAPGPLPTLDTDIAAVVRREMRKRGITYLGGSPVTALEAGGEGVVARAGEHQASARRALVAVGRRPQSADLGLEQAGVEIGLRGEIRTDDYMATSAPGIYALGDVNGRFPLAHAASAQARLAVDHLLGLDPAPLREEAIPWAIFTLPEIGCVGLDEQTARARGHAVACGRYDLRGLGRAHSMGELVGLAKVVVDQSTHRLLGAHIIGAHAGDMIHEAAVLMRQGASVHELTTTVHAHPTLSEALLEAAEDALGQATHKPLKQQEQPSYV